MSIALVDWSPALRIVGMASLVAMVPLSYWWLRHRAGDVRSRMAALTALTMFLTFDLIVFGAFTRLTDSGLGCPDWPGCYGSASPLGAQTHIDAAQAAQPDGPVTHSKAWIEMVHRYLAMSVGALILVMAVVGWVRRQQLPQSWLWPFFTLAWVIVQGLFGRYTVTWKLYPAIVTLHLLGGAGLLALLVVQREALRVPGDAYAAPGAGLRRAAGGALAVLVAQVALGGWVSTNYAVLACRGFPDCNGHWWPSMDLARGFELLRDLGRSADGAFLPFDALVAIHMAHRLFALVALAAAGALAWRLWRGVHSAGRQLGIALAALLALQVATGLSNVVLDWPIVAALMHSGGAAALVGLLTSAASRPAALQGALRR